MGIIKCPNCGLDVSSDSGECFACGYSFSKPGAAANGQQETSLNLKADSIQISLQNDDGRQKKSAKSKGNKGNVLSTIVFAVVIIALIGVFCIYAIRQNKKMKEIETRHKVELAEKDNEMKSILDSFVKEEFTVDVETLEAIALPASDLVAQKYYYKDLETVKKEDKIFKTKLTNPFTDNETYIIYSGIISAGTILDDIQYAIDEDHKTITVTVPEPKILSHEVDNDSFEYYDKKKAVFAKDALNAEDFNNTQTEMKKKEEEKLMKNSEFWKETKNKISATITDILTASGKLDDYKISVEWAK